MNREVRVLAPAKINLGLEVLAERADGYHDLLTVYQAIRLFDRVDIRLSREPGVRLCVSPRAIDLGPYAANLAVRAADLLPPGPGDPPGVEIRLTKRIPVGAGLGGGSSDGAAVLVGLARLRGLVHDPAHLERLAASLGSDAPFFIRGGTQLGRGRGEDLAPFPRWPRANLVLVYPGLHVSTAAIYGAFICGLTPPGPLASLAAHENLSWSWRGSGSHLQNDLEPLVCARHPEVARVLEALRSAGSPFVRMTGSGSAVFAVEPDRSTGLGWLDGFRRDGVWCRRVGPWRGGCTAEDRVSGRDL